MKLSQKLVVGYIRTKFRVLSSLSKKRAAEKAFQLFCIPQYRNKNKLPPIFENAEVIHLDFKGNKIRGYRWNKGANKKFLILHGFESSAINFDRYVKPMIKNGFEVLAFDAPAHGRSSGKHITVVIYKELILEINKQYGPITHFMGHSLGGLALSLALEEINHDQNLKVVLIAPATETTTAINSFFSFLQLDKEVRKEFDKLIERLSGYKPEWFSVRRIAEHIKADVLWLQDKNDELTPYSDVLPIIEKNYPNFHFIISEGLGHRRIYRDNKSFKAIIDFLQKDTQ